MLIVRVTTLVIALLWPLSGTAGHQTASLPVATDAHLLQQAARRAAQEPPHTLLRWLRGRGAVRSAALGLDGRTIDITFRDGVQMAVLPASRPSGRMVPRRSTVAFRRTLTAVGEPRAVVLNPFARNAGFDDGEAEVIDLQMAGFNVDHLVNDAVTVNAMTSLSSYSVVYMDTHSGVNQWGDGVVVTGQLASDDPQLAPLIKDHSLWIVGVAGDTHLYYGILSHFVTTSMGTFPAHALLYLNGCTLLKSTLLWQALAERGAGVMVSWDGEVLVPDGTVAGAAFFHLMASGTNVGDSVARVVASGRGQSFAQGMVGRLGYVGDGSVTLREAHDGSLPPAPAPTTTPTTFIAPTRTAKTTSTSLPAVRPMVSIARILVRHLVSGHWRSGRTVRLGEPVRFEVTYLSSGGPTSSPAGSIRIAKGAHPALSIALRAQGRELKGDLRIRDRRLLGRLTATASLTYSGATARRSVQLRVLP